MTQTLLPGSDWCQRWNDRRSSYRHVAEGGFDRRRYEVDALDELSAKLFVERNHYSKSYPASRLRYGLFDRTGALVGVAVLSVPVQRAVVKLAFPSLEPYRESLELGRFVLLDQVPANAESWFLARVFELATCEGLRGVVSFADPLPRKTLAGAVVTPGHVGIIYQASNAIYAGRGTPRSILLLPDGRVLNERALSKVRSLDRGHEYVEEMLCRFGAPPRHGTNPTLWLPLALATIHARRVWHPGNHRYLFRLGNRRVRRSTVLALPSLPYPKVVEVN